MVVTDFFAQRTLVFMKVGFILQRIFLGQGNPSDVNIVQDLKNY